MGIEELYRLYLVSRTVSTDSRNISEGCLFFALKGKNFDGKLFAHEALSKGALAAVVDDKAYHDPMQNLFYMEDSLAALQALATYHRKQFSVPLIPVTGSNGKTTTKELIVAVLSKKFKVHATKGNLNNHIGVPLTLLSMPSDAQILVVEMGANHQKEIEFLCSIAKPDYGYITNFGQAHIEGFGSLERVVRGKSELYQYLRFHGKKAFVNMDDPVQVKNSQGISRYGFSQGSDTDVSIRKMGDSSTLLLTFKDVEIHPRLIGAYNFTNIAAAIAIGNYFGVSVERIKIAVESYVPDNNRSQLLQKGPLQIILDAYNANPDSMREALLNLARFKGVKTAILGDMAELGSIEDEAHENTVFLARTSLIDRLLLVGDQFHRVSVSDEILTKFRNKTELIAFLKEHPIKEGTLLIKGSRKMALEHILEVF
ncbi:MAG: UDP-N-acetylmuramoyl-tripeptide--D-alanyl-D-alanine ligase [Flavobacteriales bacterium Tduv]